jgi:hypothetical protein
VCARVAIIGANALVSARQRPPQLPLRPYTYPVINDPGGAYKVYYRELPNCSSGECSGWPNNYIVDRSDVIVYRSSGFNGPELLAKLATLFP